MTIDFLPSAARFRRGLRRSVALTLMALLPIQAGGAFAEGLPDLGDESQGTITPQMERSVGQKIYNDIRLRDPDYVDDPEINGYLFGLGSRLSAHVEGGISDATGPQGFVIFALRNPTLNAFAMPGGYIGVHTGLMLTAQSESELASVLAHEISHVTQHHIARGISTGGTSNIAVLVGLVVALLAARSNPDLAMGAAMTGQAVGIQNQLNYSRDFEREADRLGLQLLSRGDFDVRAAPVFFERLQKNSVIYESKNAPPAYLRTHPLTTERISALNDRIATMPYKQVPDSLEFQLVRARLRAQGSTPPDAIAEFQSQLKAATLTGEVVAYYGMVQTYLRDNNLVAAEKSMESLRQAIAEAKLASPMFDTAEGELLLKQRKPVAAARLLSNSRSYYPQNRAVNYLLVQAQLDAGTPAVALESSRVFLLAVPDDARMMALQAKCFGALGKMLSMHRVQAESYLLMGQIPLALEQLELARKAHDGDFYEQSQVDTRWREVKQMHIEMMKEKRK